MFEEEDKIISEENDEQLEEEETPVSEEGGNDDGEASAGIVPGLVDVDIAKEVRSSFLDYAMSVIVARALPDVRDGLKPVHRRIIFGMNESGITPDKPYKKCARIVGDVMGKYHPHGDAAIYSTLVRLAQPFSMRYTLVDGHGNFGSVDGDEAAAMRYTEARMSKLSLEMVRDINDDTIDFVDNYDGTEREPSILPSRIPNLLINGSSGIAVGMATNMPPHNLAEVIDGIRAIALNPDISVEEIMANSIHGPDFPTGGIILGRSGIKQAYETGQGTITIRSKCEIEEHANGKKSIIVTEIPYQVNKATMIEKIADLVKNKIIDGITDIRDESNHEGIRVVIEVRKDIIPEVLLNQLYKNTQLQVSYGIINLCLVNNVPKVLGIKGLLEEYLNFQIEVIERRTKYRLRKDEQRDHIVLGLLKARENIKEVVDIIVASESAEASAKALIARFGFSDAQTQAILALPLRRLSGIEIEKLKQERIQLENNIAYYRDLLSDRNKLQGVVLDELEEIKNRYKDERKTEISDALSTIEDEDLIPVENIVITLTAGGYVKRQTVDTFHTQNRGGKGIRGTRTHENDAVKILVYTITHTDLLFFTTLGKVYRMRAHQIPAYSRESKGLPIQNLINLDENEKVIAIIPLDHYREGSYLSFITEKGLIKRTKIEEFLSIRQNGKIAISLRDDDMLLDVKHTSGSAIIGIASSLGKMVKFNETDARAMGRTASGVKAMNTDGGECIGAITNEEGSLVLVLSENGYGKMTSFDEYRMTNRGTKGVKTLKTTEKVGNIVCVAMVNGNEDLMVVTDNGVIIRTPLEQVRIASRNTQGVRIIQLDNKRKVSSVAIVPHEEEVEEESDATNTEIAENPAE